MNINITKTVMLLIHQKEKITRYLKKRKMDKATSSLPSLAKEHNFCSVSDTTKHGIIAL